MVAPKRTLPPYSTYYRFENPRNTKKVGADTTGITGNTATLPYYSMSSTPGRTLHAITNPGGTRTTRVSVRLQKNYTLTTPSIRTKQRKEERKPATALQQVRTHPGLQLCTMIALSACMLVHRVGRRLSSSLLCSTWLRGPCVRCRARDLRFSTLPALAPC